MGRLWAPERVKNIISTLKMDHTEVYVNVAGSYNAKAGVVSTQSTQEQRPGCWEQRKLFSSMGDAEQRCAVCLQDVGLPPQTPHLCTQSA